MVLSFFSAYFDHGCTLTEPGDPSNLLFTLHKKEMIDFVQNMYPGLPKFIGLFVGDIMSGLLDQLSEEFHRS